MACAAETGQKPRQCTQMACLTQLSSQASCAAAFASCGSWGPISNRQSVPVPVDSMQCTLACMHSSPLEDTTVTLYCTVPFSAVTDRLKAVLQLQLRLRWLLKPAFHCNVTLRVPTLALPALFTVTSEHTRFYFLFFPLSLFIFWFVLYIKLAYVSFWPHVK